jgi:hypothetical protein
VVKIQGRTFIFNNKIAERSVADVEPKIDFQYKGSLCEVWEELSLNSHKYIGTITIPTSGETKIRERSQLAITVFAELNETVNVFMGRYRLSEL